MPRSTVSRYATHARAQAEEGSRKEGRQSGEIKVLTAYCKTEDQWDDLHVAKDYGNDYYFIRQLFEQNWTPQSTTVD